MELIHADEALNEIGFIREMVSFDAEISQDINAKLDDNTLQLVVGEFTWETDPILTGHYIYVDGTEWGGRVEGIKHSTASGQITLTGPTWRGMLYRKVIEPPAGQAYLTITAMDANAALAQLIGTEMSILFNVSTALSGINITGSWRYENLLLGIERGLAEYGLSLRIAYNSALKRVVLSAEPVEDLSDTVDLSQDYGVDMITAAGGYGAYNHIIALGKIDSIDTPVAPVPETEMTSQPIVPVASITAIANGGTGASNAVNARTNLGAAATEHEHNAGAITAGTLPVPRGGTGLATVAANSYLKGNGTGGLVPRTYAEVLSDIAALPLAGGTLIGVLRVKNTGTHNTMMQNSSLAGEYLFGGSAADGGAIGPYIRVAVDKLKYFDGSTAYDILNTKNVLTVAQGGTGVTTIALLGLISYPINSVYISYGTTSPATLFGGTWTALTSGVYFGVTLNAWRRTA